MKRILVMVALLFALHCACAETVPLQDWEPHGEFEFYSVETSGDYIYALEAGSDGFSYDPPYCTTVYDLAEKPLFTVEGYFANYFDEISGGYHSGLRDGFGVMWTGENRDGIIWGVVSDTGEMLMDNLTDVKGHHDGYIYYSRSFGIPLLDKIADKLDINTGICGRFNLQGDRLELIGSGLGGEDEQGYMILQLWGWDSSPQDSDRFVYVDDSGEIAIEYAYEQAYPFVNGAAVVKKDGRFVLIDPQGEVICEISQGWNSGWMSFLRAFSAPVLPMDTQQGMVLINRRGEIVNDTPFAEVSSDLVEWLRVDVLICEDAEGISHFVDAQGKVLFSLPVENRRYASVDPDVIWVQSGGLWGRLDVQGRYGEPGRFTSADRYQEIEILDGKGQLPDGSWVTIGDMGQATGPAEAPDYSDWK